MKSGGDEFVNLYDNIHSKKGQWKYNCFISIYKFYLSIILYFRKQTHSGRKQFYGISI